MLSRPHSCAAALSSMRAIHRLAADVFSCSQQMSALACVEQHHPSNGVIHQKYTHQTFYSATTKQTCFVLEQFARFPSTFFCVAAHCTAAALLVLSHSVRGALPSTQDRLQARSLLTCGSDYCLCLTQETCESKAGCQWVLDDVLNMRRCKRATCGDLCLTCPDKLSCQGKQGCYWDGLSCLGCEDKDCILCTEGACKNRFDCTWDVICKNANKK